jgi:putative zinc finger protein
MNCQQVEKLLPLFGGRDLNERKERAVAEHLETCGECAGAATEYAETRQLLQEFAPPAFSDEVYAGIRQNVLRQIETESSDPSLLQLIAGWFRPRFVWAAASVVLIAITALGVYFIANRSTQPQPLAGNAPKASPSPENEQLDGSDKLATASPIPAKGRNHERRQANDRQAQRRLHRNWALDRANRLAVNSPDAKSKKVEPPATVGVVTAVSEKTLRMEIQTKNPNIRIIWFSQRESKPISPHSKGI